MDLIAAVESFRVSTGSSIQVSTLLCRAVGNSVPFCGFGSLLLLRRLLGGWRGWRLKLRRQYFKLALNWGRVRGCRLVAAAELIGDVQSSANKG